MPASYFLTETYSRKNSHKLCFYSLCDFKEGFLHLAPLYPGRFFSCPSRGTAETALIEEQKIKLPLWLRDPLVRAATPGELGRIGPAPAACTKLSTIKPNFDFEAGYFINASLMNEVLIEGLFGGLYTAGLKDSGDR